MPKPFSQLTDSERDLRLQTDNKDDCFESQEQAIWYNVISQALADALKLENKNKYKRRDAVNAITWLLHNDQDFKLVCNYAGVCPINLRNKLWPWLHEKFPFSLRDGGFVSPVNKNET